MFSRIDYPATHTIAATLLIVFALEYIYPATFFTMTTPAPAPAWTIVTSMLAHSSFIHLLSNLAILYMVGVPVEHHSSGRTMVAVFLVAGLIANLGVLILTTITTTTASFIGASGAISAILGVYAYYYPTERLFLLQTNRFVPLFIAVSIGIIVIYGVGAFGVAHSQHAIGALTGVLTPRLFSFTRQ